MSNIPQDVIDAARRLNGRSLFTDDERIVMRYVLDQAGELPPPEVRVPDCFVDGWIAHTGSERPVAPNVDVMVRIASDASFDDLRFCGMWAAEFYRWDKLGISHDITHYKIVSTPESSVTKKSQ